MRQFILGTDWSSDCDDVLAVRLLCRAHKKGEIKLLGINIDDKIDLSVHSLSAFLTSEGCEDIPIGFDFSAKKVCKDPRYQKRMCLLPSKLTSNDQAEDSVSFYRRLLASASEPVEIVEIGYLQSLMALLKSKPDRFSPLPGAELVKQKVKKMWIMAGKWSEKGGKEHNFTGTKATKRGGVYLCKNCSIPITFLGWEVADNVLIGGNLPADDIAGQALYDYGCQPGKGRDGWDPMLVRLALVGDEEKAGYSVVRGKARLSPLTGKNYFSQDSDGLHRFVVKNRPDEQFVKEINELLI